MSLIMKFINELQVNGQTVDDNDDFNVGEDETPDAKTQGQDPADAAQADSENQTQNDTAQQQDDTGTDAQNTGDEDDNFTLDDTEATDENTPTEEAPTDDGNTGEGDTVPPEDTEGDDDFTVDGGDEESPEGDDGTDDAQGGNSPAENKAPADPSDAIDDDEERAAEEAIYDSLTDDQKRIRVLQLKLDYKDLYETMTTTIEGVNRIPKNSDNIETVKRLILLLTKAKKILIDYVENNFDANPYLENYTMYIKYMAVFRTAMKVIEEINYCEDDKK